MLSDSHTDLWASLKGMILGKTDRKVAKLHEVRGWNVEFFVRQLCGAVEREHGCFSTCPGIALGPDVTY